MGMFDDLIPTSSRGDQGAPPSGGMFDDLIPKQDDKSPPPARQAQAKPEVPKQDVDLATRAGMAANRGIATMLGAPADFSNWITQGTQQAVDEGARWAGKKLGLNVDDVPTVRTIPRIPGGAEDIKQGIAWLGRQVGVENAHPDSATQATTLPEKMAEAAGEGVAMAVLPGMSAEALAAKASREIGALGTQLAKIIAGGGAGSNALMGAGGGAAGAAAEEYAPESIKPIARMGGEILGGGVAALGESAVRDLPSAAARALGRNIENPNVAAARRIIDSAEPRRPGDEGLGLRQQVDELVANGPGVPGSDPTMFQLTGDKKIGELERTVRTQNPGAYTDVLERQGVARTNAVNTAVPDADTGSVGSFLRQQLDSIEAGYAEAVAKARADAQAGLSGAGGTQFTNAADYGGGLQRELDALNKQRAAAERKAWDTFTEGAGDKPISIADFRKEVAQIEGGIGRLAKQPKGDEVDILNTIRGAGDYATFSDIGDLRSQLTDALRGTELTATQRRRVSMILEKLDATLDNAVDRIVIDPTRNIPIQESLANGLTADDIAKYGTARQMTRERKETFESGAVGDVLGRGDRPGTFAATESSVIGRLLKRPEDMRAFVNAAGDSPATMALAQDALAFDMRRKAVTADGILSPERLKGWVRDNTEALEQFPELRAKFADARTAQETLDAAIIKQKDAIDQFQTAAVKRFLADKDPHAALEEAMRTPEAFRSLVDTVKQDQNALAGLKRLAVELILKKGGIVAEDGALTGVKEAGTSGTPQLAANAVQKFFLNKRGLLADLFDEAELKNIAAVTTDMQRAARTVKIPDQSNTMQDMPGVLKGFATGAWNKAGGTMLGGTGAGLYTMDPMTAVAGAAVGKAVDSWRTYYQGRVDKALTEMMLDPKVFAIWAPKVKEAAPDVGVGANIARKMRALLGQQVARELERVPDLVPR